MNSNGTKAGSTPSLMTGCSFTKMISSSVKVIFPSTAKQGPDKNIIVLTATNNRTRSFFIETLLHAQNEPTYSLDQCKGYSCRSRIKSKYN